MNKGKLYLLCTMSLVSAASFGATERSLQVQNTLRVGSDDNVYATKNDRQQSAYVTDVINITGKMNFSSRTDLLLYWQPEVRYRFDADPETVSYQDLYARFDHGISERLFMTISDRLRYQDKDGQTSGLGNDTTNQNYFENNVAGALDFTINSVSAVQLGGSYEFREWDENNYGQGIENNNYTQYQLSSSYNRQLNADNTTLGVLGVEYNDLDYEGSRGGYKSTTVMAGIDQIFNPNVSGNFRAGASVNSLDGASDDTTTPYAQAGLEYNPSERTTLTSTLGYSVYKSQNSFFNAQNQFNFGLGARHDLTGKISLSSSLAYIHSDYNSDYARSSGLVSTTSDDATEDFIRLNVRASYQINRNNFVDAGYEWTNRDTDTPFITEYNRNIVDIGWRLRL